MSLSKLLLRGSIVYGLFMAICAVTNQADETEGLGSTKPRLLAIRTFEKWNWLLLQSILGRGWNASDLNKERILLLFWPSTYKTVYLVVFSSRPAQTWWMKFFLSHSRSVFSGLWCPPLLSRYPQNQAPVTPNPRYVWCSLWAKWF